MFPEESARPELPSGDSFPRHHLDDVRRRGFVFDRILFSKFLFRGIGRGSLRRWRISLAVAALEVALVSLIGHFLGNENVAILPEFVDFQGSSAIFYVTLGIVLTSLVTEHHKLTSCLLFGVVFSGASLFLFIPSDPLPFICLLLSSVAIYFLNRSSAKLLFLLPVGGIGFVMVGAAGLLGIDCFEDMRLGDEFSSTHASPLFVVEVFLLGVFFVASTWWSNSSRIPKTSAHLRILLVHSVFGLLLVGALSAAFGLIPQQIRMKHARNRFEVKLLTLTSALMTEGDYAKLDKLFEQSFQSERFGRSFSFEKKAEGLPALSETFAAVGFVSVDPSPRFQLVYSSQSFADLQGSSKLAASLAELPQRFIEKTERLRRQENYELLSDYRLTLVPLQEGSKLYLFGLTNNANEIASDRKMLLKVLGGVLVFVALGCLIIFPLSTDLLAHALNLQAVVKHRSNRLERELKARVRAEEELRRQGEFLRQVVDINPHLIFAKDRGGRFTLVNQALADAYGQPIREIVGKTDAEYASSATEVRKFREDDLCVLETHTEIVIPEEPFTDAHGRKRWFQTVKRPLFNERGEAHQILGVATDITVRKEAEEGVSRLAAIVESSTDAIVGTTLKGIVTSWNRGAELILGYSATEIIGHSVTELIAPERVAEIQGIFARLVRGERIEHFETVRRHKLGHDVHVSLCISPIRDLAGNIVGASAIARDISKRKEIEAELQRYREHLEELVELRSQELLKSQARLVQAERLASIGALAAGIAHEINNPVGAILLATQNVLELSSNEQHSEQLTESLVNACKRVEEHAKRCRSIVKGILQFSRAPIIESIDSDVTQVIKHVIELQQESIQSAGVLLRTQYAETLPKILLQPGAFEQVIINLLQNSVRAVQRKFKHELAQSLENREGEILVQTAVAETGEVQVIICDNGCGIATDHLSRIFDPFFTTELQTGGTGLGLSVVHGIVTSLGGKIQVESKLEEGTRFTLSFLAVEVKSNTDESEIVQTGITESYGN